MRYILRNTPEFVGNTCTSIGGDVVQNQLHANAGLDPSAQVLSQADTHGNAYDHPNLPFLSVQPVSTYSSKPTATQDLDVSYPPRTNLGGVNAGLGLNAGASANVGFGGVSTNAGFNMDASASGTASLATSRTAQLTQELTQSAIQRPTQTTAALDIAIGSGGGQGTLAGSSGQYDTEVVSGQTVGQATQVITLAGSEDVQLGSEGKGQASGTQSVGQVATTGSSGQYCAGFLSGQAQGQANGVTSLGGSKGVQLGEAVASRVASNSTQAAGQASTVQQTTQATAEQATHVTAGQNTQETTQSLIQAQASKDTTQSSAQKTTQTAAELNAESANTSGLVNVSGLLGQYVGGSVTADLHTGAGSTLGLSAGAGANVGLSAAVSSGHTAQVTTDQVVQQIKDAITHQSAQTSKIDGMTKSRGSRRVAWESTRGVGQSSSVKQPTESISDQIAEASTEVTVHSATQQTTQTSTKLDVDTRNKNDPITADGLSAHYGGHVPDQTRPSSQQIAQVSTEETTQSSTHQTTKTSAELDVRKQTRDEDVVDVVIINGGKGVQHGLETRLEGWESTQDAGQLRQTSPSISRQVSQTTTETSGSEFEEISMELGVRTGNTGGTITVSGSSEEYNGGASVQTQEETVGAAIVQGGEDVHGECATGQVSTQGVTQPSSVQ